MPAEGPYKEIVPKQLGQEKKEEKEIFDWNKTRDRFETELQRSNDPRRILDDLLSFPDSHFEDDHWDDYLTWIYDHTDELLKLASVDVPGVADRVLIALGDTHAFIEERGSLYPEYEYETKADDLRKKILGYFRSHIALYVVGGKSSHQLGLRLATLSKITWLCKDSDFDLRSIAQGIAVQSLKEGWTDEDRNEGELLKHTDLSFDIGNIVEHMLLPEQIEEVAYAVAARVGVEIDLRKYRLAEKTNREKNTAHHAHLRDWVSTVTELEAHAEGVAKKLQEDFGIVNFNHFPIPALKNQYDMRDAQVPYGVVLAAQFDHNDAFTGQSQEVISSLFEQLSERKVQMRIIEVNSPRALAKRMLSLDTKYGDQHKISFALVRAHGTEIDIGLGQGLADTVNSDALKKLRPENLQRFFIKEPDIIFDSCSVGADGGLASEVASVLGGNTHATGDITHGIKDIKVFGDSKKLDFSVTFKEDKEIDVYQ
jgi:hypothetical protein